MARRTLPPTNAGPRITRRRMAQTIAAVTVAAQAPAAPQAPLPGAQAPAQPLPQNPEEELKAARSDARQRSELMAKVPLPMSTEPAFVFKA